MKLSPQLKESLVTALFSSLFTLVILLLTNFLLNHSWNLFVGSTSQPFTVQGTGSVTQKPDSATVSFTITKTANTLQDAQNQANTSTNTMVADVKKLGIAEKDIKTSNYNSYPNYDTSEKIMPLRTIPSSSGTAITGYTVSENVDITLSDISKANSVIDVLTKDSAENVSGPNLTFSQSTQDSLTQKARLAAIADAKKKAEVLANAAGVRLGRITNVQEGNTPFQVQPLMLKTQDSAVGSAPTQIQPGENTITVSVTLSYQTW